ncbi:MAG: hypothetical protein GX275_01610 [Clostridiales bacterium]|nr:hypothetical protein [Clostridiales bacterium]
MGQTININDKEYILSEDNINDFEVSERINQGNNENKIKIKMNVEIDNNVISLAFDTIFDFKTNWQFNKGEVIEIFDVNSNDNYEKILMENIVEKGVFFDDNSHVYGYKIKEIREVVINKNGINNEFSGKAKLTNGMYYIVSDISGNVDFDLDTMSWKIYNIKINTINPVEKEEEINEDIIKDEIKHFISMENNNPYEYIYTINERDMVAKINLSQDVITDINIIEYMIDEDKNIIKYTIEGIAEKEILKKISFSGTVNMPLSVDKNISSTVNLRINNVIINNPEEEILKEEIVNKKINNKIINENDAKTFKILNTDNIYITKKYVNGTININDKKINIQIQLNLGYDKNGKQLWTVSDIYTENMNQYEEF